MSKRAFDVFISALGLLVLFPLFAIAALLIKLDSPGPVFFRQERVGRDGRCFRIHKFRTMRHNCSVKGQLLTIGKDARVTRIGHLLRHYKVDELPQLIDVFLGDMSLVGPRPEVPEYVKYYSASDRTVVLSVRPGITDRASLKFRDESLLLANIDDAHQYYIQNILPEKIRLYRDYVHSNSIISDIGIIFATINKVVMGKCRLPSQ